MGLFGRGSKKQERSLQMRGYPGDAGTNQCLLMAAERGVRLDTELVDLSERACDKPEYRAMSPLGKVPCLRDGDFVISGAPAVLAYLDIKGQGNSLNPKKASILGEQNYWVDLGQRSAGPVVSLLLSTIIPGSQAVSQDDLESGRGALARALTQLNATMADGRQFIVAQYSFADIHWTCYLHLLMLSGEQAVLEPFANVLAWLERMKLRKGTGGQLTYDTLPTLDEIQHKRLKSVA